MKRSFGSVLLAIVLGMVLLLPLAGTASADPATPITVGPNSYVTANSYVHYVFGHWNTSQKPVAVPGSDAAHSQHGWGNASGSEISSTTTYTATTATPAGEYQLGFDVTMNNWLSYGGYSDSYATLPFTVTSDTDYNISGSYTTNANQGGIFRVRLKDLGPDPDTFVFDNADTLGTLSGPGLTGTLPPGDYEFEVFTRSIAWGQYPWAGVGWGPISGGPDQGTGSVHLDLTAQWNNPPVAEIVAIDDATITLPVTMKVTPQTLNLSRLGKWVKAHITDDTENTPQVMEVTLDGSGSSDIDDGDEIVSWDWTLTGPDGEVTVDEVEITTISLSAGAYTVNLVVNDGDTDSAMATETFTLSNQTIDDLAAGSYALNGVPDSEVKGPDNGSVVISFADDDVAATVEVGPDHEMVLTGTASGMDEIDVIEGGKDGSKGKSGPKFK